MKLTKIFYEGYDNGDDVDIQINDFVKENNCEIIDVKYQLASNGYTTALLIYEVKEDE